MTVTVTVADKRLVTAEDLALPGAPEKFVELMEGELIEMTPAGWRHARIAYAIAKLFDFFCAKREGLGFAADNAGFFIERNPDTVLSPDAALFHLRPIPKSPWYEFAPEVVVEVLSPSNTGPAMVYKRGKYFRAGTEQFWLVDPEKKTLVIYYRDGRTLTADGDSVVACEGIAEGLQVSLPELFKER